MRSTPVPVPAEPRTYRQVLAEFRSLILAGLSGSFLTLPGFLVSPVAGAMFDRVGAVRAVILNTLVSAVLIGLIVVASVGGCLTPVVLLTLLTLYSLTSPSMPRFAARLEAALEFGVDFFLTDGEPESADA